MAGIKISALPAASAAQLSDVFPADQTPGPVTRKITLQQVLDLFGQSGVPSISGSQNEVLVNGTYGTPITGTAITLTTPQQIATTNSPTFVGLNLSSTINGVTGISNAGGALPIVTFTSNAGSVNYINLQNRSTGLGPIVSAVGGDTDLQLNLMSKGQGAVVAITQAPTNAFIIYNGTASQHETIFSFANTAQINTVTWPDSSGTVAYTSGASGIVNPGLINQLAYYAAAGTTLSGLSITNQGVLTTNGSGVPAWVQLIAGQVLIGTTAGAPVAAAINSGTNITVANGSGTITVNLSGVVAPTLGGTGVNNGSNTLTLAGTLATVGAFASSFTMTGATAVTFPTSGTLATTSQLVTPAALTKTDDTNVTLTLGGSPSTALVNAASLTLGWTGQLGLTRGGTAASLTASNGGIVYSSASALAILGGTATANQLLMSGASTTPAWSTTTYPATNAINTIMYASSANVLGVISPVNSAVMISSSGGIPSMSTTLPSGIAATNMNLTTPTLGVASATSINFGGSALNTYAANSSWTPAMTFATPGDLSVAYTTQSGTYSRIGNIVCLTFVLACSPTYTTASGNFQITGLPFTIGSSCVGTLQFQATAFPGSTTYIYLRGTAGNSFFTINGSGPATSTTAMTATQIITASNVTLLGTITYLV